jgi:hypothetical protein
VSPRTGLDDMERRNILLLPGLEHQPLSRSACSKSLYQLRYHYSTNAVELQRSTVPSGCCDQKHARLLLETEESSRAHMQSKSNSLILSGCFWKGKPSIMRPCYSFWMPENTLAKLTGKIYWVIIRELQHHITSV